MKWAFELQSMCTLTENVFSTRVHSWKMCPALVFHECTWSLFCICISMKQTKCRATQLSLLLVYCLFQCHLIIGWFWGGKNAKQCSHAHSQKTCSVYMYTHRERGQFALHDTAHVDWMQFSRPVDIVDWTRFIFFLKKAKKMFLGIDRNAIFFVKMGNLPFFWNFRFFRFFLKFKWRKNRDFPHENQDFGSKNLEYPPQARNWWCTFYWSLATSR